MTSYLDQKINDFTFLDKNLNHHQTVELKSHTQTQKGMQGFFPLYLCGACELTKSQTGIILFYTQVLRHSTSD